MAKEVELEEPIVLELEEGTWDRGIDYHKEREKLLNKIREVMFEDGRQAETRFAYYSILLIQLDNGLRISEAVEAFKKWIETGDQIVDVVVKKKKAKRIEIEKIKNRYPKLYRELKRKGVKHVFIRQVVKRKVRIPKELYPHPVLKEFAQIDSNVLVKRVKAWASKHYRKALERDEEPEVYNTHAYRYGWISAKLKEGANPAIVAKAIKHADVKTLLKYVEEKEAEELILKEK